MGGVPREDGLYPGPQVVEEGVSLVRLRLTGQGVRIQRVLIQGARMQGACMHKWTTMPFTVTPLGGGLGA